MDLFAKVLIGVRVIWQCKNSLVHGGKEWTIDEGILRVERYSHLFCNKSLICLSPSVDASLLCNDKWVIFSDGSWYGASQAAGFAALA